MRIIIAYWSLVLLAFGSPAECQEPELLFDQPIQEYFSSEVPYTHLGTTFGTMGPAADQLVWRDGRICATTDGENWAGVYHVLAGQLQDSEELLRFDQVFPPLIRERWQPRCEGLYVKASGVGSLQLELKSGTGELLWSHRIELADEANQMYVVPLPDDRPLQAKFCNWVVNGKARICVDAIGLRIRLPRLAPPARLFLVSYAKLARCYSPRTELVRDKLHVPPGEFDCIPTSGMFCLATAVAADLGLVDGEAAERIVRGCFERVSRIERAAGLLPHFVATTEQETYIARGTEFSTVDTALWAHSMLLAAQILDDQRLESRVVEMVQQIDWSALTDEQGRISHGLRSDGATRLTSVWDGWGGETALVMLLRAMSKSPPAQQTPPLRSPGKVYQGVGFIAEIQSLFYPHFQAPRKDAVTGVNWLEARHRLLTAQRTYFDSSVPARQAGVYGLSAGEAFRGQGYVANGVEQSGVDLIHPHYMLLSASILPQPRELVPVLERMSTDGLLPPWGLVENVRADLSEYLAFHGSLNASFEALSSYHWGVQLANREDVIYAAALRSELLNQAIRSFYPDSPQP